MIFWLLHSPSATLSPAPHLPLSSQSVEFHALTMRSVLLLLSDFSPFGPLCTYYCCRLFYSMNWCIGGLCITSERKGCRTVRYWVTKGTLHPEVCGVCLCCRAAPSHGLMHQSDSPSHYQPLFLSYPQTLTNTNRYASPQFFFSLQLHLSPPFFSAASPLLPFSSLPNSTRLPNPKQFLQTSGLTPYRNGT